MANSDSRRVVVVLGMQRSGTSAVSGVLESLGFRSEKLWEDNNPMNNAIRQLNAKPLRRYRIYQKEI